MKLFSEDIKIFKEKLENGENFTFSKYADGEWAVMKNQPINNKEFWFDPNKFLDNTKREKLIESFQFNHPQYFVGISCPCCQGMDVFKEMKSFSMQQDEKLTWANLWVNSNYKYFVENIIPTFIDRDVILFCNRYGDIENLPFRPKVVIGVENNAWEDNWSFIDLTKRLITEHELEDHIFLFCCGPFGNILACELTKHNDKNSYIDIGSTLNPWLKSAGFERHYYAGNNIFSQLTCRWG